MTSTTLENTLREKLSHVKKAVVWGPRLHTHTHSYVWKGYYDAFDHLGIETHWMDDRTDLTGHDLKDVLFIVLGGHDNGLPIRDDCWYVLHNVDKDKYVSVARDKKVFLQVYTHDVKTRPGCEPVGGSKVVWWDQEDRTLYQPWATDLLPHQFEVPNPKLVREPVIYWTGSITDGPQGNVNEMRAFFESGKDMGLKLCHVTGAGMKKARHLIQKSAFGLALQGAWQVQAGYVPCRAFKVASMGRIPLTNSEFVHEVLDRHTIFFPDCARLVNEGIAWEKHFEKKHLQDLMSLVRDHHTYLNRVLSLAEVLF